MNVVRGGRAGGARSQLRRNARWAMPAGVAAAVGLAIAVPSLVSAQSSGAARLPARSTDQLLTAVEGATPAVPPLRGTIRETAALGLPALPGSSSESDPLSPTSLLSGSHTFDIWYGGPARVRVALPVTLGEADIRQDGRNVWVWDSKTNTATHLVLPASAGHGAGGSGTAAGSVPTPQQAARQLLAAVGPTTRVSLRRNVTVAGQPGYQLSVTPKDSRSLIGQVTVVIDAHYALPLRVQVFARGSAKPAFQVAYTSLSLRKPAASNFSFSPPPGATVKTVRAPAARLACAVPPGFAWLRSVRARSTAVKVPLSRGAVSAGIGVRGTPQPLRAVPAAVRSQLRKAFLAHLPKGLSKAQRAAMLRQFDAALRGKAAAFTPAKAVPCESGKAAAFKSGWTGYAPLSGRATPPFAVGPRRVLGKGWLSVLVLRTSGALAASPFAGVGVAGPGSQASGIFRALLHATTPVHGSWGSGRLLRTRLLSVLIMNNGQVLIGAVQPTVLYADAAQLK